MKLKSGSVLTTIGGIVGAIGVVAWAIGLKMTLAPQMQDVFVYTGLLGAAAILLVAGAVIGRREHRAAAAEAEALRELAEPRGFDAPSQAPVREEKLREL